MPTLYSAAKPRKIHSVGVLKGFGGKDVWEKAKVLMMAVGTMDQWVPLKKVYMKKFNQNAGAEKENRKHHKTETLKTYLNQYSRLLEKNKTGWFFGSSLTWPDLETAELLTCLKEHFDPTALDGYPKLAEYAKKLMDQPQRERYLERRPKTLF